VSVSLLSSAHSVVYRNVGSESHMVNVASDSLFKLDEGYKYNKILSTHVHLGFKFYTSVPEDAEDDQNMQHAVLDLINLLCMTARNKLLLVSHCTMG
jgi:hypothetical protein